MSAARFRIASRLGAFRDTATLLDPLGTSARFIIHRANSNAHRRWFKDRMDNDPRSLIMVERMMVADLSTALTKEEEKTVEEVREMKDQAGPVALSLLPIIDRLTDISTEQSAQREALRQLLSSGVIKPSDITGRGDEAMLEEALFALKSWEDMPDENGKIIPYSLEMARELLTNDTPLEGVDHLVLSQSCWTIEIKQGEEQHDIPARRIPIPGLTLGRAYQIYILAKSRETALFKTEAMEAAAKNSEPSSDSINSSGGGEPTSGTLSTN